MIGVDIVEVARIKRLWEKYPRFKYRIFTEEERAYIGKMVQPWERMAGLFAAKEAIIKAATTKSKLSFQEIEIRHRQKVPYGWVRGKEFKVSISHERHYAVAVAQEHSKHNVFPCELNNILTTRKINSHKGDYGRLAVVAGSYGMTGCAHLSAMAALRMGAGLVYNVVPGDIVEILSIQSLEAIVKSFSTMEDELNFLKTMDAIAIGPGMGTGENEKQQTEKILSLDKKMVVDADGITNLKDQREILTKRKPYTTVLTPHMGEFSRISHHTIEEILKAPLYFAQSFANEYRVILLLKGAHTIVTDGKESYVNETGNPGMATAGSGDVLTGMIGALLCKMDPFMAAKLGAYLHGLAGDEAKNVMGEESMLARDLINGIAPVLKRIKGE